MVQTPPVLSLKHPLAFSEGLCYSGACLAYHLPGWSGRRNGNVQAWGHGVIMTWYLYVHECHVAHVAPVDAASEDRPWTQQWNAACVGCFFGARTSADQPHTRFGGRSGLKHFLDNEHGASKQKKWCQRPAADGRSPTFGDRLHVGIRPYRSCSISAI